MIVKTVKTKQFKVALCLDARCQFNLRATHPLKDSQNMIVKTETSGERKAIESCIVCLPPTAFHPPWLSEVLMHAAV